MNPSNDIVSKFTDLFDIPNDDKEYDVLSSRWYKSTIKSLVL